MTAVIRIVLVISLFFCSRNPYWNLKDGEVTCAGIYSAEEMGNTFGDQYIGQGGDTYSFPIGGVYDNTQGKNVKLSLPSGQRGISVCGIARKGFARLTLDPIK